LCIYQNERGRLLCDINSKICKQFSLKQGSTLKATFADDESEYQFQMPEELQEVLRTDEKAGKIFQSLSPGKQRGLIALVLQVKSMDKRIEQSLKIAEKLRSGIHSPQLVLKKGI